MGGKADLRGLEDERPQLEDESPQWGAGAKVWGQSPQKVEEFLLNLIIFYTFRSFTQLLL